MKSGYTSEIFRKRLLRSSVSLSIKTRKANEKITPLSLTLFIVCVLAIATAACFCAATGVSDSAKKI